MSELFISQLADLEFTEGDKIKIEDRMFFFVLYELSEKFCYLRKIVCSSGHLQYFIIKTLDTKTKPHSRKICIFFIDRIDEI
jgi:hypothetical protein